MLEFLSRVIQRDDDDDDDDDDAGSKAHAHGAVIEVIELFPGGV